MDSFDGARAYRLHVPYLYNPDDPAPLVMNYHGSSQTALAQETYSQLVPLSDREGFILLTPEGSGYPQGWDIPGVYNDNGFDDVNASVLMLAQVKQEFCVDPDRVYATGMSNGAEMAALVGCRQPDLFAAIAPVSGVIYEGCEFPGVAVIAFHGTEDYNIPFEYAPEAMEQWARHNGCESGAQREQYTDNVEVVTYGDCQGRDVVLYIVQGGGHTWPGAEDNAGGVGPTTHEISANELMWAFFQAHPRIPAPLQETPGAVPARPAALAAGGGGGGEPDEPPAEDAPEAASADPSGEAATPAPERATPTPSSGASATTPTATPTA